MMYNKLIFLDFDGVITTYKSKWNIDNEKCEMIKYICDNTGAKIVISSSWRYTTLENTILKNHLEDWLLKDYCIGVTKRCNMNYTEDCSTSWFIPRRGMEIDEFINRYIKENNISEEIHYVIIDDDVFDLLYNQRKHIIKTHWKFGISKSNVKKAINILNKK